jgi:hypothetical protein
MVTTKSIDMTAQIQDTISIEHQLYWLARSSHREGLFNPTDYGISPVPSSSACNRGFYCSYIISDRQLLVMDVNLTPNMSDRLKFKHQRIDAILCGKSPCVSDPNSYRWQYRELSYPISYTGGLLVCNKMNHELNVIPGFPSIYLAGKVYEAIFDLGNLIQIVDHSEKIAEIRNSLRDKIHKRIHENSPPMGSTVDYSLYSIMPDIQKCFHFHYP